MSSSGRVKPNYLTHNEAKLIRGGHSYFEEFNNLIKQAKLSIQLQVYIFDDDQTGSTVAENLIAACQRGVAIQILLDGYASGNLANELIERMRKAGIKLRFFEPIFKGGNYYFGRRLHHKILVVDGQYALVGGINISDRYNDIPGIPAWLDFAIFMEGEIVFELHKLCNHLYAKKADDMIQLDRQSISKASWMDWHCMIRLRRNDWVMNRNQISATYMEFCRKAKQEIIIMSSYFIPGSFFRHHIVKAIKRGVNVKLILAGVSDVGLAKDAERYLYRWAMANGIQIFEYKQHVLHGKVAICDGRIVTIGSYNINDISALASIELNMDIDDPSFSKTVHDTLSNIIENGCDRITTNETLRWNAFARIYFWLAYSTVRLLFRIFTFYLRKRNDVTAR
jgi:cardiolipin synthase A/B